MVDLARRRLGEDTPTGWRAAGLAIVCVPSHPRALTSMEALDAWRAQSGSLEVALEVLSGLVRSELLSPVRAGWLVADYFDRAGPVLTEPQQDAGISAVLLILARLFVGAHDPQEQVRQEYTLLARRLCALLRGAERWNSHAHSLELLGRPLTLHAEAYQGLFTRFQARLHQEGNAFLWDRSTHAEIGMRWAPFGPLDAFANTALGAALVADLSMFRARWNPKVVQQSATSLWQIASDLLQRHGVVLHAPQKDKSPAPPQIQWGASLEGPDGQLTAACVMASAESLLAIGEPALAQRVARELLDVLGNIPGPRRYQEWARNLAYWRSLS